MTDLPEEMLLDDAEEFFKLDVNRFPKKKLTTSEKHIAKMVLLNSLSEDMIQKREIKGEKLSKADIIEINIGVLESDYPSMGTAQILDTFTKNDMDIKQMCRLGAKGIIRKIEMQNEKPLNPHQIEGLADSLEYDMKSSATRLKMKDRPNAVRLYDCATTFGNELREESKKRKSNR